MKVLLFCFAAFVNLFALSQSKEAVFEAHNADLLLLDSLIFEEVNVQRLITNKAKIFKSDSLDIQANQHSRVMAHAGDIFYSSFKNKAGECNLKLSLGSGMNYQEIAKIIVDRWKASPGHAELILGEYFIYGGCGVSTREMSTSDAVELFVCFRISYWP